MWLCYQRSRVLRKNYSVRFYSSKKSKNTFRNLCVTILVVIIIVIVSFYIMIARFKTQRPKQCTNFFHSFSICCNFYYNHLPFLFLWIFKFLNITHSLSPYEECSALSAFRLISLWFQNNTNTTTTENAKEKTSSASSSSQERDELSLTSTFTTIRNKLNTFMLNQIVMKSTVDVTAFVPLTPQIVSRLGQTDTSNHISSQTT